MFLACDTKLLSSQDVDRVSKTTEIYLSFLDAVKAASRMKEGGDVLRVVDAEQDAFIGFIVSPYK